jgi:hypothetical protein
MDLRQSRKRGRAPAFIAVLAFFLAACTGRPKTPAGPSPDEPARVSVKGQRIRVAYEGADIFTGDIRAPDAGFQASARNFRDGDRISTVILLTPAGQGEVSVEGTVFGSREAFPCEADRRDRGPALVRHSSGLSRSLLNRAVYDRLRDWAFSVDAGPRAALRPAGDDTRSRTFGLEATGGEIVLRFRPRYYQVHRGLRFFEPWTYRIWPRSVAGWISWFAFYDRVTEKDIVETADVLADVLLPFGYEYLQIDDGYQRGEGLPELWLNANAKFPQGLSFLPSYIASKGLKPGIWTNVAFKQADFAAAHPNWFVTDESGKPAPGDWIGFSLDASNDQALDAIVKPVYQGLRGMGWEYFKVDALRHLRYEGYNAHADYFRRKKLDLVATYRRYVETVRAEIGPDAFLLGCWGIRPELIGLIDACRIGTDGFSYAGLAQYNSWNNVVWRNDPDHIQLNDDRYRSALVTSLTGSILLLTDRPEVYRTEAAEAARRAAPVLETVPGQIFDIDPSRSDALERVGAEVSGSGPRVFDAGLSPSCDLFLLEIQRPFENWAVLGRTGDSVAAVGFSDLGLDPSKEYFVFEFWTKNLRGSFQGGFAPGTMDSVFKSQSFVIRERVPHPQVLATNRHVTGGGVDLLDVRWKDRVLSGRSRVVGKDPYAIFLTEPEGYRLEGFECDGASLLETKRNGLVLEVRMLSGESREIAWLAKFKSP